MSRLLMDAVMARSPFGGTRMAVMMVLADFANDDGVCWPSIATIAQRIRRSRAQTQRVVHELIRHGYLVVLGNEHGGAPGSTRRMKMFPDGNGSEWTGLIDATGSNYEAGRTSATGLVDAQDGSHWRTGGVASTRPEPFSEPVSEPIPLFSNSGCDQGAPDRKTPATPECPHQEIINAYHELVPTGRQVRTWGTERQRKLRARWREDAARQSIEWWRGFFAYIGRSDFLTGRAQSGQRAPFEIDLEWIVTPTNFAKIVEGKYENRSTQQPAQARQEAEG